MAKILIVDDMRTLQKVIQVYLTGEGHEYRTAGNGAEALELMRADPPHLVISDVKMPDMDGLQLCERMHKDAKLHAVPVLLMSGSTDVAQAAKAAGAGGFVKKPIDPDALVREVKRLLGKG